MIRICLLSSAAILGLALAPAHAVYVKNDPINQIDPTGLCSTDAEGKQIGVCGTDAISITVLETTKVLSPETRQADSTATSQGTRVPFTFNPDSSVSKVRALLDPQGNTIAQAAFVGGKTDPLAAVNTETGATIAYAPGPLETTAHEVGGHVLDNLTGPVITGQRDPSTPNAEVNAMAAGNTIRTNMGVPVRRDNYAQPAPMDITPNGVRPPKTAKDFLPRP